MQFLLACRSQLDRPISWPRSTDQWHCFMGPVSHFPRGWHNQVSCGYLTSGEPTESYMILRSLIVALWAFGVAAAGQAAEIRTNNEPAQLDIRPAGENSIRITLKPIRFVSDF